MGSDFNRDRSSNRIAIAFRAAQSKGNGIADLSHLIAQHADLRCVSILENNLKPAVVVEIAQHKGAAVVWKVKGHRPGDIGESAVTVV